MLSFPDFSVDASLASLLQKLYVFIFDYLTFCHEGMKEHVKRVVGIVDLYSIPI